MFLRLSMSFSVEGLRFLPNEANKSFDFNSSMGYWCRTKPVILESRLHSARLRVEEDGGFSSIARIQAFPDKFAPDDKKPSIAAMGCSHRTAMENPIPER
jgi:hypothetical protein